MGSVTVQITEMVKEYKTKEGIRYRYERNKEKE
jgi:hypothetical protein